MNKTNTSRAKPQTRRPQQRRQRKTIWSWVTADEMRNFIGCAVVTGLLIVAVVMALRIPLSSQVEILRNILSLLGIVIVALYGGNKNNSSRNDSSKK